MTYRGEAALRAIRTMGLVAASVVLGACGAGGGNDAGSPVATKQSIAAPAFAGHDAMTTDVRVAPGGGGIVGIVPVKPDSAPLATSTRPGPATRGPMIAPRAGGGSPGTGAFAAAPGSGRSPSPAAGGSLRVPALAGGYVSECLVDFKDGDAVVAASFGLYFDRIYLPWFQQCGAGGWVDLRPLVYEHVHLGFASMHVVPCPIDAFPSRIDDDGECDRVDLAVEQRTHVMSHDSGEFIQVRALAYNSPLPDYTPLVFDLQSLRIIQTGASLRVCYHKANQQLDGPWVTAEPGGGQPGIWMCWNRLEPGHWDLSDWATGIDEVRITGAQGDYGPASIDDLKIGIR